MSTQAFTSISGPGAASSSLPIWTRRAPALEAPGFAVAIAAHEAKRHLAAPRFRVGSAQLKGIVVLVSLSLFCCGALTTRHVSTARVVKSGPRMDDTLPDAPPRPGASCALLDSTDAPVSAVVETPLTVIVGFVARPMPPQRAPIAARPVASARARDPQFFSGRF